MGGSESNLHSGAIQAKHYSLEIKGVEPINIWLTKSDSNIAYFVQISGRENGNSYNILLEGIKE